MSDAQLTLILSAIGVLGGSLIAPLRWAVGRVTSSNDAGTAALIANTASNAVLIVKLDHLAAKVSSVSDFVHEYTPVDPQPKYREPQQAFRPAPRTPAGGVRVPRRGTHHDGDE